MKTASGSWLLDEANERYELELDQALLVGSNARVFPQMHPMGS